jgi:cation:H+ antiporter
MILFFSIFIYYLITLLSRDKDKSAGETARYKTPKSVVVTLLGLIGIILGSNVVVENVAAFAASVGISQKIISVTIIAVGTSLPELVTTVTAAKKGENNMAIGNIVGSNIFNICVVLGLPVALLGEAATAAFGVVDMVFMLMSVVLLWIFSSTNRKLKRYEAGILISVYCAYCVYIFAQ